MGISKNIKNLRHHYKLSQRDLAVIAGVSDKAVSTWENASKEPRMGTIQKIADHFGLQKSNIIEDNGLDWDSSQTTPEKLPQDLRKFLMEETVTFNGEVMSLEDKLLVEQILTTMYQRSKDLNKRDK